MPQRLLLSIALATTMLLTAITPFSAQADNRAKNNQFWWPNSLDLQSLRQNNPESNPYGDNFDYAAEFATIDIEELKTDLRELMTTSQDWWPADYGHYGPFFIRLAWHSAGTYRVVDGRGGAAGGQHRLAPLNSWPDNANLDKARRLLWPLKQKYGRKLSWADLMVLSGTVAMESMGFKTFGFAGGREDDFEPDLVYWGPEKEFLARDRFDKDGKLEKPLGASRFGLIYVNPEGPNANHDPLDSAREIRQTFARMAMNDEETVALIAGGHTFGKAHGARNPSDCVGAAPEGAEIEEQGLGWKNKCGTGKGIDTTTSGLEGAWTANPTQWTTQYVDFLLAFDWKQEKSPAGAVQWVPESPSAGQLVPDAHDEKLRHAPIMLTSDLALKEDPAYRAVIERFKNDPTEFEDAFARAWFKLTHRDMGPRARYVGDSIPEEILSWQDPVPTPDYKTINARDIFRLKKSILSSELSNTELVKAAWASASSFRATDFRGGANGARVRLAPQKDWAVNEPETLAKVLQTLEGIQTSFNEKARGGKQVSMADLIVLGGAAAIERAALSGGVNISVPFTAGRGDASQEQTEVDSFAVLEPTADGFRNYFGTDNALSPTEMLVEKAALMDLTVPQMTALLGGMRALNANTGGTEHGVLTDQPGTLSNDFFVDLLDMSTQWERTDIDNIFQGSDRTSGEKKWTATPVDLIFGSSSELRTVAEVYAADDGNQKFVEDFVAAWTKVMTADRFDL